MGKKQVQNLNGPKEPSRLDFASYNEKVSTWLRMDDAGWKKPPGVVEAKTKIDRLYIFYGVGGVFCLYLILGHFAALVCTLTAFVYPAYASMKAIRSEDKDDDTQWLIYWTVFGVFSIIDFASDRIIGWFPIYWLSKCLFLVYLQSPASKGAQVIWERFIGPKFDQYADLADQITKTAGDKASEMAAKVVNPDQEARKTQ